MRNEHIRLARRIIGFATVASGAPALDLDALDLAQMAALVDGMDLQVVARGDLGAARGGLEARGVRCRSIEALFDRGAAPPADGLPPLSDGYPKLANAFQLDLLRDGEFHFCSPYEDRLLSAMGSIPISTCAQGAWPIAYEFDAGRPVIVGAGCGWAGATSFIWLVEEGVVVTDGASWSEWTPPKDCIARYLLACARHHRELAAYRAAEKIPAVAFGFIHDFRHYLWNDVSGLERVVRCGLAARVERVYARGSAWLPTGALFGEFAGRIFEHDDGDALIADVLANRDLIVRPTGTTMDRALAARLHAAARVVLAADPDRCTAFETEIAIPAFTLVFTLRAPVQGDVWLEQVQGLVAVVEVLGALHYPRPRIYLAGSLDCADMAADIREALGTHARIVDGLGATPAEAILWAFACDYFVASVGDALAPLTWIADKPGICHGNHAHMQQLGFWPHVRRRVSRLVSPDVRDIVEVNGTLFGDYSLAPKRIAELAHAHLEPTAGRRTEQPSETDVLTAALAHAHEFAAEPLAERDVLRADVARLREEAMALTQARDAAAAERDIIGAERDRLKAELNTVSRNLGVAPGHFYSPVIDIDATPDPNAGSGPPEPRDVTVDLAAHMNTWARLAPHWANPPCVSGSPSRYAARNDDSSYPLGDAIVLQAMIADLQPRRYVEVGSGFSTAALLDAVDAFCPQTPEITLIEPYPELVQSLLRPADKARVALLATPVQQVPLSVFEALGEGDILFIDSTHVLKTGNDVHFELFEVLPRLASGVNVHLHDIFWPFEYPSGWIFRDKRSWNELYAVRAFLAGRSDFEIVFFNHFFRLKAPPEVRAACPAFFARESGGLWLRKR